MTHRSDPEPQLQDEHVRLLATTEALEREHEDLHGRPGDRAAHEAHRARLRAHIDKLHTHISHLRTRML